MAKKEKSAVAPAESAAPKAPKVEQNGVTRPGADTTTGQIWLVADQISAKIKAPAPRSDVFAQCKTLGINEATIATQYGKWRKFNGVVATPKVAATAEEKAAAKAAKATAKAAEKAKAEKAAAKAEKAAAA